AILVPSAEDVGDLPRGDRDNLEGWKARVNAFEPPLLLRRLGPLALLDLDLSVAHGGDQAAVHRRDHVALVRVDPRIAVAVRVEWLDKVLHRSLLWLSAGLLWPRKSTVTARGPAVGRSSPAPGADPGLRCGASAPAAVRAAPRRP